MEPFVAHFQLSNPGSVRYKINIEIQRPTVSEHILTQIDTTVHTKANQSCPYACRHTVFETMIVLYYSFALWITDFSI